MSNVPEPDAARHGAPEPAGHGELRHILTVQHVEAALVEAGVPRSRRQVIRYCETGLLEAVKVPGPTGAQWFVSPASLPKAIGDLKQWETQRARRSVTELDTSGSVTLEIPRKDAPDTARHGAPEHAVSDRQTNPKEGVTEPDTARHRPTELAIFEHPYVKKLEAQVEKLEGKLDAQVRRTEEIQTNSQKALIELQRMVAVGQSQTLADFMLQARDWVLGKRSEEEGRPAEPAA